MDDPLIAIQLFKFLYFYESMAWSSNSFLPQLDRSLTRYSSERLILTIGHVVERMFTKLKSTVALKFYDVVVAYSSRLIGLSSRQCG